MTSTGVGSARAASPRVWVAVALLALTATGIAVLDDYGVSSLVRPIGHAWLDYVVGDRDAAWGLAPEHRVYGPAFEAPLALIERGLGLTDSRDIHLARQLLTHLTHLAGAAFAALLAWRLFGSGWLALFALAIFALHPRLYAHSFFNSRDLAFAAMFMVCLHLAHRAFRRDTAGAFALLGVSFGVLMNLRVMGALLVALVAGLKALDGGLRAGWPARRHTLGCLAALVGGAAAALYAAWPLLWANPLRIIEVVGTFAQHPNHVPTLFHGELVRWPHLPAHFVACWVCLTTPPAALTLCLVGMAATLGGVWRGWRGARSPSLRLSLLLVACPVLALAAVPLLEANVHDDWRHLFFLWAPLGLLAVVGLKWLAGAVRRPGLRRGVCGVAAAGVAAGVAQMVALHPQQALYFNFMAPRDAPERIRASFAMDYALTAYREAVAHALGAFPEATVRAPRREALPLPEAARRRLVFDRRPEAVGLVLRRSLVLPAGNWPAAEFDMGHFFPSASGPAIGGFVTRHLRPAAGAHLVLGRHGPGEPLAPTVAAVKVYDNTLVTATALDVSLVGGAGGAWRAEYLATIAAAPAARAVFDLHVAPNAVTWVKAPCGVADMQGEFRLAAESDGGGDGARPRAEWVCDFRYCGVRVGSACLVRTPLPGGIGAVEVSQRSPQGAIRWRTVLDLSRRGDAPR